MTLRQHEVQSLALPITQHFGHLTLIAFYRFGFNAFSIVVVVLLFYCVALRTFWLENGSGACAGEIGNRALEYMCVVVKCVM